MDLSKYCEHRRKVLIDHVDEGYVHHLWLYNSDQICAIMKEAGAASAEDAGAHAVAPSSSQTDAHSAAPGDAKSAAAAASSHAATTTAPRSLAIPASPAGDVV